MDSRVRLTIAFTIVDALITFGCLDNVAKHQGVSQTDLLSPLSYHPTSSFLEPFLLWLARFSIAQYAAYLSQFGLESKWLKYTGVRLCLIMGSMIFSGLKLLALDETLPLWEIRGAWMLLAWSVLAPIAIHIFWRHCMKAPVIPEAVPTTEEEAKKNKEEKEKKEKEDEDSYDIPLTMAQYWAVIEQSLLEWKWFGAYLLIMTIESTVAVHLPGYRAELLSTIAAKEHYDTLYRTIVMMGTLECSKLLIRKVQNACTSKASRNMQLRIKNQLFGSLIRQDIAFYDTHKPGELINCLDSDCSDFGYFVSNILDNIQEFVKTFHTLLYMLAINWQLTILSLLPACVSYLLDFLSSSEWKARQEKKKEDEVDASQIAHEVMTTIHNVRSHGCERFEAERYRSKIITEGLDEEWGYFLTGLKSSMAENVLEAIQLIALVTYGIHLVTKGTITTEVFVAFFMYQRESSNGFSRLYYTIDSFTWFSGSSRKVLKYMSAVPEIPNNGTLKPQVKGCLSMNNVTFTYPSRPEAPVLKDFSLTIAAGETVALVGHSGAGKSSVVSLLEHFYAPQSGSITLDGDDIGDIEHEHYHQRVALVAQEPVLYGRTIRENIIYGREGASEEEIIEAAKMANAHGFITELPDKYDTLCGERGVRMSGGQKQRIAIARALVRNPAVLILDEATSALDAESEAAVQEAITKCAIDRTVIIIAHRLSTIKHADRIVVLSKGSIAEQGSHFDLMAIEDGIYRRLVRKQLRVKSVDLVRRLTIDEVEQAKSEDSDEGEKAGPIFLPFFGSR